MPILEAEDVEKTSSIYDANVARWKRWGSAYDGAEAFIDETITQHERESTENFKTRKNEAEVWNYCEMVVNTYARFLSMANPDRDLGPLDKNELFEKFQSDVDLYGTDYAVFWPNMAELAGIYGFVGILVDKPPGVGAVSQAEELKQGIYPYFSVYIPENILDWRWERNKDTARPELAFLKLKESETSIVAWTAEEWERWTRPDDSTSEWEMENSTRPNPTGVIPLVWYTNYKDPRRPHLGYSDIKDIARVQSSITRDLSHGGEVIKHAAFPMLALPERYTAEQPSDNDDVVGVTAIQEFDPENPNSKPSWIESSVGEPIQAVLDWDQRKEEAIYRMAALSVFYGKGNDAWSGVALRFLFKQLESILAGKANSLDEAEARALRLWGQWQDLPSKDISVTRSTKVIVDELKLQIETLVLGKTSVRSESFKQAVEKRIARLTLEDATEQEITQYEDEIDLASALKREDFIGES